MDKYKFGEFIYQKRKALGLTQDELGRKLGVTNKAVSKWEVGETLPEITMLEPLAKIFMISVDELLTQREIKVEERKTIKVNKLFLILTIIFGALFIFSIIGTISYIIYDKNKEYRIDITNENYEEIINIDPMINFVCEGQSATIKSGYELNNKYYLKNDDTINFVIEYEITYYYYLDDGSIGMITYFERTKEVVLSNNLLTDTDELTLSPQTTISNFQSFISVNVKYEILSFNGKVYLNKN